MRTSPNGHSPANLKGLKILLVDDDPGTREALTDMLGEVGADVKTAANADEAMYLLEEFKPDEMVLDIAMPGEDGYSLLKRIRTNSKLKSIPALALTALASDKDKQKAFSAGFQMHLTKPVNFDNLTGALLELSKRDQIIH